MVEVPFFPFFSQVFLMLKSQKKFSTTISLHKLDGKSCSILTNNIKILKPILVLHEPNPLQNSEKKGVCWISTISFFCLETELQNPIKNYFHQLIP